LTPVNEAPKRSPDPDAGESPALLERFRCATFAPNIDSKGRWVRLSAGILVLAGGCSFLLGSALPSGDPGLAVVAALAIGAGAFMIFEARAHWCVWRALGFRTRW
jgi:hypothetical protein